jgi:large subunit ribosomal protein L30
MSKVRVTQVRSKIGQSERHRGTLRALGLGKIGRSAEHAESRQLAGMLRKVAHLVKVEGNSVGGKETRSRPAAQTDDRAQPENPEAESASDA